MEDSETLTFDYSSNGKHNPNKRVPCLGFGTGGRAEKAAASSLKSQLQTQVPLTQPHLQVPEQTQIHPSTPQSLDSSSHLCFSLCTLSTSGIFSSVLNSKTILNPVSSPAFFLEVITVLNLKFASHSQQKNPPQLSRP